MKSIGIFYLVTPTLFIYWRRIHIKSIGLSYLETPTLFIYWNKTRKKSIGMVYLQMNLYFNYTPGNFLINYLKTYFMHICLKIRLLFMFQTYHNFTSRVTMSKFSVTRGILHSQCLNKTLKAERPYFDEKRTDHLTFRRYVQSTLNHMTFPAHC